MEKVVEMRGSLRELLKTWQARVDDLERASDGHTWQGEMTEIRRCIQELEALVRIADRLSQR
jgi:hypothetical protein